MTESWYTSRTFIQTTKFEKDWKSLGFDDEDLRQLELMIMENPEVGAMMQGTGGLRKMRFAFEGRGKSGSTRVGYVDFAYYGTVFLLNAYSKDEKDNLSKSERNEVKKLITAIERHLKEQNGGKGNE